MKKSFLVLLFAALSAMSGIARDSATYYITIGRGIGYQNTSFINNTIDMSLPNINGYWSVFYQLNFIKKRYSIILESQSYSAEKKLNDIKVNYSEGYLYLGYGKKLSKRWELGFALGAVRSTLTVKKQVLNSPPDSLFNHFQFMTNEYRSKWTPSAKAGIRYFLFSTKDDVLKISLICSGLYKLKTEKFFVKQAKSNFLFTLGLNVALKLY